MSEIVHVLNGDVTERELARAGIPGRRVVWREMLTAGPLAPDWREPAATAARGRWLQEHYGIPEEDYVRGMGIQSEEVFGEAVGTRTIVLWMDPDLFDQAILMALSWRLEREAPDANCELVRLPFGPPAAEKLAESWMRRLPLDRAAIGRAAEAWEAYSSSEAEPVRRWLTVNGSSSGELPDLAAALLFHLERFADAGGLGVAERLTVQALNEKGRPMDAASLFREVGGSLPLFGLGDLQYWRMLERLAAGDRPLLTLSAGLPLYGQGEADRTPSAQVTITEDGRKAALGRTAVSPPVIEPWLKNDAGA